jgi:hypothetical protein
MVSMFVGGPFLCCLCSVIFKLRHIVDVRKNKTTDLVFDILLYFRGGFVSFCPSFVLVYVFLEIYQMGNTLLSVFIRKIC